MGNCMTKSVNRNKQGQQKFEEGLDLLDRKEYANAIKCFDKAVELDNKDYISHFHKGRALDALEKESEAIESYDMY